MTNRADSPEHLRRIEMNRKKYFGVIIATVIALGAVAYAQSNHLVVGKTGHLTLKQEVRVGDAVLPPGDYEVRHRRSANGHFVEFTRVTENDTAQEGLSPYDWVVMADVPCTMKSLNEPVATTIADLSGGGVPQLTSLRVRGENVIHVFPAAPDAPAPYIEYGGGE
jgi:hypothetical protein